MLLCPLLLAAALAAAPRPDVVDPWSGLLGSGLLTLQDTSTLAPGRVGLGLTIDNRDRDPLGLDIVDGAIAVRGGVTGWAEAYGQFVLNRSVAVPDTPVNPPPPLDLLVPAGARVPARPYYSLYAPAPYHHDTGVIHFGAGQPGDALVGLKARVLAPQGARPGVALNLDVRFPLGSSLRDLQAGAGTGGVDLRTGAIAEWRADRWSFVAVSGFTRVGQPSHPDRIIRVRDGRVEATDEPLLLPYRLDLGAGVRRSLGRTLALVGEVTTIFETGRRTPTLDRSRPVDFLIGLQARRRNLQATAALRDHRNALPSVQMLPSPLAGFVDLTAVTEDATAAYLQAIGFGGAVPELRAGAHRLLVPPPAGVEAALPAGARVIPAEYRISSEHQLGFLFAVSVSF
ncbi:MAG: hypothetical protein ABW221_23475 [Vicinamibacteria bacterium]